MSKPRVIALAGDMFHGKTTVAKYLEKQHGLMRHRFAGPIKALVSEMLYQAGDTREAALHAVDDTRLKDTPIYELYDHSPRDFMRSFGDVGRSISKEFWANIIMTRIHAEHRRDNTLIAVIDDWRYPEGEGGRMLAGDIEPFFVRVNRPGKERSIKDHSSEGGLDDWAYDFTITNVDGDLDGLYFQADVMLKQFIAITADEGR
jgi:hypothetical protein